uniref:RNA-directed RNA polymerase L n=1 Tax=European wheat striate mosaic virus TaxID=2661631 RepID=A0A5P9KB75_9VIRU|nr:pC1 [European wheat striate mosaic virus]
MMEGLEYDRGEIPEEYEGRVVVYNNKRYPIDGILTDDKSNEDIVKNAGGGHCLFYSLVDAMGSTNSERDARHLCKKLHMSGAIHVYDEKDRSEILREVDWYQSDEWGTSLSISLFCMTVGVNAVIEIRGAAESLGKCTLKFLGHSDLTIYLVNQAGLHYEGRTPDYEIRPNLTEILYRYLNGVNVPNQQIHNTLGIKIKKMDRNEYLDVKWKNSTADLLREIAKRYYNINDEIDLKALDIVLIRNKTIISSLDLFGRILGFDYKLTKVLDDNSEELRMRRMVEVTNQGGRKFWFYEKLSDRKVGYISKAGNIRLFDNLQILSLHGIQESLIAGMKRDLDLTDTEEELNRRCTENLMMMCGEDNMAWTRFGRGLLLTFQYLRSCSDKRVNLVMAPRSETPAVGSIIVARLPYTIGLFSMDDPIYLYHPDGRISRAKLTKSLSMKIEHELDKDRFVSTIFPSTNSVLKLEEYSNTPSAGFTFPPFVVGETAIVKTPSVKTSKTDDHIIEIKYDDDDRNTFSETIKPNFIYRKPIATCKNIIHDFVFDFLAKETDMSFKEAGLSIGDSDDNQTPDLILNLSTANERKYVVYEFTTRSTDSRDSLVRSVEEKGLKYKEAIIKRCSMLKVDIAYYVIAVSLDAVATNNTSLSRTIIDELIVRLRVANQVRIQLSDLGFDISSNESMASDIHKLQMMFKTNFPNDKFIEPISEKLVADFIRPLDEGQRKYVKDLEESVEKKVQSMMKEHTDNIYDDDGMSGYSRRMAENELTKTKEMENEYLANFDKDNYRDSMKAPVQLPLIIPTRTDPTLNFTHYELFKQFSKMENDGSTIYSVWYDAIMGWNAIQHDDRLDELEVSMLDSTIAKEVQDRYKKDRKKYNRTVFAIESEHAIDLAKIGINARSHLDNPAVQAYRDESRRPFSVRTTYTDDIELFTQKQCLELEEKEEYSSIENVIDLILNAIDLHDPADEKQIWNNVSNHANTRLAIYSKFISDLATELTISMSQNCNHNTFILKKLRDFNCYLLIKPVNLRSNIFFSLYIPEASYVSHNTTFKKLEGGPAGYLTDFVSANMSKLVNWVRCEAVMLSQRGFWNEFYYACPDAADVSNRDNSEIGVKVTQMMSWVLILLLNDKHQTEEMVTLSRFIHMEGFVTFPKWPNPSKMFAKFSLTPRSSLEVLIIRRMIKLMYWYAQHPIRFSIVDNKKVWGGFKNPFLLNDMGNLDDIEDQDQMLNLFYLGYLKNKDEEAESNAMGQIVTKILGWENVLPESRRYLGAQDPPIGEVKKHEFSISYVKHLCDKFLERISKTHNITDPKKYLGDKILKHLNNEFVESLASLKASSNFSYDYYWYKPNKSLKNKAVSRAKDVTDSSGEITEECKKNIYHRSKVIEKLTTIVKGMDPNAELRIVSDLLPLAMKELNENKCMHICIFKKNQHGGLREIYVLNIFERIMQKTIEDFSRAILESCPSETMTSPKNKFKIPEKHNQEARLKMGQNYITLSTSDDASKWSQGHYVSKFMCMMLRLTPDYLHGFIVQSLQLWHHKKIFLGDQLLTLFNENVEIHTMDSAVKQVFDVYKGREKVRWMNPGQAFIETESGMMQGILHYTSSLFHAIYLDHLRESCEKELTIALRAMDNGQDHKCVVDNMESSDDSSFIISVPYIDSNPAFNLSVMIIANSWFDKKELLGYYLGIYKSPKSTTNTLFVMEFNSEFFFGGDVHRPTFRWVNAAILVGEQETLAGVQEEMSNTLKDVIEGGGSFFLAFMVQVAQAVLHYRLLGSSVAPIWPAFETLLKNSYDPALGFFLMDNPKCAGLMGFNYNLWNACASSPLGEKYEEMIESEMNSDKQTLRAVTEDTLNTGLVTRTTMVGHGNKKRWLKMMKELDLGEEIYDEIEENPRIYFFHSTNATELKQKIAIKVKSPGVIQSLSKGNMLSKRIATSAFFLSRHIVFTMSAYYDTDPEECKTSLIKELIRSSMIPCKRLWTDEFNTDLHPRYIETSDPTEPLECEMLRMLEDHLPISTHRIDVSRRLFLEKYAATQCGKSSLKEIDDMTLMTCTAQLLGVCLLVYKRVSRSKYELELRLDKIGRVKSTLVVYRDEDGRARAEIEDLNPYRTTIRYDNESFERYQNTIALLFPCHADYLSLKETLGQIEFQYAHQEKNMRRRVRADVHLTGTEGLSRFPLYAVAVRKWFGVKTLPAHDKVYDILWGTYRERYPWLGPSIQATMQSGPYKKAQGIVNFTSRDKDKHRVVHLVGSFGKNTRGNINLITAIKDNFSNGIAFKGDIFDIKAKETRENFDSLVSIMTTLSQSPLPQSERIGIVRSLLVKGSDIARSALHWGSRRNKFSMYQTILRSDPDLILNGASRTRDDLHDMLYDRLPMKLAQITEDEFQESVVRVEDAIESLKNRGIYVWDPERSSDIYEFVNRQDIRCYMLLLEANSVTEAYSEYVAEYKRTANGDDIMRFKTLFAEEGVRNWYYMIDEGSITSWQGYIEQKKKFESERINIVESIRNEKLGIIGSYTDIQGRNKEGNYYGKGEWRGTFDDKDVVINVDSRESNDGTTKTHIVKVTISNPSDLVGFIHQLKNWCRDNHIDNECSTPPKSWALKQNEIHLCNLLSFKKQQFKNPGCPLIYNSYLKTKEWTDIQKFVLDLTTHSLRLCNNFGRNGRISLATIMTAKLQMSDIQVFRSLPSQLESGPQIRRERMMTSTIVLPGWVVDWLLWRSSPNDGSNILSLISEDPQARAFFQCDSYAEWLRKLYMTAVNTVINNPRLIMNHDGSTESDYSEEVTPSNTAPEEYKSVMDRMNTLMNNGSLDSIVRDSCLSALYKIPELGDLLVEKEEVFRDDLTSCHPLLVSYVRAMVRDIGIEDMMTLHQQCLDKEQYVISTNAILRYKEVLKFMFPRLKDTSFQRKVIPGHLYIPRV